MCGKVETLQLSASFYCCKVSLLVISTLRVIQPRLCDGDRKFEQGPHGGAAAVIPSTHQF
jgi:hypothetical protein